MITDDGRNDMRGCDYVKARAAKCPRCKEDITPQKHLNIQTHTCGMRWTNVGRNKKLVGYNPFPKGV